MGINKIEFNGNVIMDLTNDGVTEDTLAYGVTAHNAAGDPIVGRMVPGEGGTAVEEIFYVPITYTDGEASLNGVTFDDIVSANNSGKTLIAKVKEASTTNIFQCIRAFANSFVFHCLSGVTTRRLSMSRSTTGVNITISNQDLQSANGRIKTIGSWVTDDQYPSAKAVYDFVQANQEVFYVNGTFDMSTLTFSTNVTYNDILSMVELGKYVVAKADAYMGDIPTNVLYLALSGISYDYAGGVASFEGMMQVYGEQIGLQSGLIMLAVTIEVDHGGDVYTRIKVVSTQAIK